MLRNLGKILIQYKSETIVSLVFLILYSLISLVNHYNFRTAALDLGMFNHALHSFSQGKMNYFTLDLSGNSPNYFADHFSPLTLLYTPLYYIFGSWTLLLVQIAAILFGALGCYKIARIRLPEMRFPFLILVFFLGQWAIVSALAFDFHNNVVAAMFVPWFFYYLLTEKRISALVFFVLILFAKENMALWMFFIILGFMLRNGFRNFFETFKTYLKFEIPLMLISLIYFYVVVSMIMPSLSNGEAVNQIARFGRLGSSIPEIVAYVISHPFETFKLLFISQLEDPVSFGIKRELHMVVLFSGGIALLLRPAYLLMLAPIYAQKLFSDNMVIWGINGQYSIEFTPILGLALIDLLVKIRTAKLQQITLFSSVFLVIATNFYTLKNRVSVWYDATTYDITRSIHYQSGGLNVPYVHNELKKIKNDIPISVSACLAPHLVKRDKLYHFPILNDAEMVVLIKSLRSTYPVSIEEQEKIVNELINSGDFEIIHDKFDLLILKKKVSNK
jgi:uncharacterized membrane protein